MDPSKHEPRTEFVMYAGQRTIGGVIFSVTYGKSRVVLEFGSAYDPATAVFDGAVEPRNKNYIRDMLRVGLLPAMDGMYRREDLGDLPLVSAEESGLETAVFITHLHLDHMALIGTVAPSVPVYMHHGAVTIERALETVGEGVRTLERTYRDVVPGRSVRVGAIEVLPILCRDTGYRDFAYLITTPDGTVHWTGDLCLHGLEAKRTFDQMELLKERKIDVMLCDCTSFMDSVLSLMYKDCQNAVIEPSREIPAGMLSEKEFYEGLYGEIEKRTDGLCAFNFYQRETDDAARFIDWAIRAGRKCVFEPDAAYILYKFFNIRPYVYVPDSARYTAPAAWFTELMQNCTVVKNGEIWENPGGYLLQNSYRHIMELMGLPSAGGAYLHADGIPIGEFDPAYKNMVNIVKKAGFEYVTFFCESYFGHGYPPQVKYFVDEVDPRVLIPCHSYNPERLKPKSGVQLLPAPYKKYILKDHTLRLADEEVTDE